MHEDVTPSPASCLSRTQHNRAVRNGQPLFPLLMETSAKDLDLKAGDEARGSWLSSQPSGLQAGPLDVAVT